MTDQLPTERGDAPDGATRADRWRTAVVAGGADGRGELASSPWRLALLGAGVVSLGVFAGTGWLLVISALFIMIFLHELGHFVTAKWTGMKVTEFFIGVGPKVWSFRRGETEYGLKLIPFVAYVRIIGMNNLDDCAPEDEPRTYRQQSFPKRMLVITAGSGMHFIQAFVLFIVVFTMVGVPGESILAERAGGQQLAATDWIVGAVTEGSAADRAGIRPEDKIVRLAGERIEEFEDIGPAIVDRIGDRVPVTVERGGETVTLSATIGAREDDAGDEVGFLGVGQNFPELPAVTTGPADGVVEAGRATGQWMWETTIRLGTFFTGGLGNFADSVTDRGEQGPVVDDEGGGTGSTSSAPDEDRVISIYGVARIGADTSEDSFGSFLLLLALVNISVGVLNLIPLLPLDGGHAAIAVYERIRSRNGRRHMADVSRLLPLTYAVVLFLGLVMVSSVYMDIVDPVGLG